MIKPWSISTTLRNPNRLRDFLIVLSDLEDFHWDKKIQEKYQILLIQKRVYGYKRPQFYNGLAQEYIEIIDDPNREITYKEAEMIFYSKNYTDPPMRGRQSFNPLKKFGFAVIKDGKVKLTNLGHRFLDDNFDIGEIFLNSFLKWQLPNPYSNNYKSSDGYNIKPFIGVIHLIDKVNQMSLFAGETGKGISRQEFSLFCPTLVNYGDIDHYANTIFSIRRTMKNLSRDEQKKSWTCFSEDFAGKFINSTNKKQIKQLLKNLLDYGDNTIRYFRMTRFFYLRGGGFYLDLEPRRNIEIRNLIEFDNARSIAFENEDLYIDFISDIKKPIFPWQTIEKLNLIANDILQDIRVYEKKLDFKKTMLQDMQKGTETDLKELIQDLRKYRRELQNRELYLESQKVKNITKYITTLKNIFQEEDRSIVLEKFIMLGLCALNDAVRIKPNYPVGDDNEPTFTAPANIPDIECFYDCFNSICEVTMLRGRDQWYYEGQPVMRHLRDFEKLNKDKDVFCLFIAPKIHRDTLNTFWIAVKYEYEGIKQKIIPFTIENFIGLLRTLIDLKEKGKKLKHMDLFMLYSEVLQATHKHNTSDEWLKDIPKIIQVWHKRIVNDGN